MPTPDEPFASRWFREQIQPHEPLLRSWLRSRFPEEPDCDDIIQEAYMRVLKAAEIGEVLSPKAFLFATARNLALTSLRRKKIFFAEPLVETDELCVSDNATPTPESVALNQEIALLTEAIQALPERCRQVFTLRKLFGLSQREIAAQLGISECTVSAQLVIGLQKCTEFFAQKGFRTRKRHE
jgi:RNA polymerase sigma-70 factor (ECF subfamily)